MEAIPFKIPQEDDKTNVKNIILQNNFSNTNLGTISKQLDRIEKTILKQLDHPNEIPSNKKLKLPIFKPFQISETSVKTYQNTNIEFIRALQSQLSNIEIGENSKHQAYDVPDTPTSKAQRNLRNLETQSSNIQINTLCHESDSDKTIKQFSNNKINRLDWRNSHENQIVTAPDIGQIQPIEQSRFNSSSVYDWNLDGISEYNILNFLQKMTMAANAYRTQIGNEDKTVAELLIAGFSGQLKGWWDNYLTNQQRGEILDAIKIDEEGMPIIDNFGNTQQNAVATLVLAITLHFIGDPSVLRDKNAELLSNLKCKKLSDFQWYKNTFLTRVLLRQDSNQPFWKEKFLAGLPTLLGEKVRTKIRESSGIQIIDYDDFTYGELVSLVQQEGLKICQDLKLQKHLKWELKRTKVELGSFCKQFEMDPTHKKSCEGNCKPAYYSKKSKFTKNFKNYRPRENSWNKSRRENSWNKSRNKFKPKESQNKPFYKNLTCYKCNKKGHTSKYCRLNKKIQELDLGEEITDKISNLLVEYSTSSSDYDSEPSSEEALQVDELNGSSSSSDSDKKKIQVLTKDQELQLEILNSISDPQLKQ